jgi:hypothetical protein
VPWDPQNIIYLKIIVPLKGTLLSLKGMNIMKVVLRMDDLIKETTLGILVVGCFLEVFK